MPINPLLYDPFPVRAPAMPRHPWGHAQFTQPHKQRWMYVECHEHRALRRASNPAFLAPSLVRARQGPCFFRPALGQNRSNIGLSHTPPHPGSSLVRIQYGSECSTSRPGMDIARTSSSKQTPERPGKESSPGRPELSAVRMVRSTPSWRAGFAWSRQRSRSRRGQRPPGS